MGPEWADLHLDDARQDRALEGGPAEGDRDGGVADIDSDGFSDAAENYFGTTAGNGSRPGAGAAGAPAGVGADGIVIIRYPVGAAARQG